MVRQTAERLQDHKGTAAVGGMVQDLSRDQDALSGIEGVVDDRITFLYELRKAHRRAVVEQVSTRNLVRRIVGEIKEEIGHPVPELFLERLM